MTIILYAIAAMETLIGIGFLISATQEKGNIPQYIELYIAISTMTSAALFGGLGRVISLLKQIAQNNKQQARQEEL